MRIKKYIFFSVCAVIILLLVFFFVKPALISLEVLTVAIAILLGVNSFLYNEMDLKVKQIFMIGISVIVVSAIFLSSYSLKEIEIRSADDLWKLLDRQTTFLLILLAKLVISFFVITYLMCFFLPGLLSKTGAKVFGIEISHEFNLENFKSKIIQVDKQFKLISTFNSTVAAYLGENFENRIFNELKHMTPDDAVRFEINRILHQVYHKLKKIKIQVIPTAEEAIETLEQKYLKTAWRLFSLTEKRKEDKIYVEKKKIGYGIHHGIDNLSAIIIIDATEQEYYELSYAEIAAASSLFLALLPSINLILKIPTLKTLAFNGKIRDN
jgi:hypothetical protein